MSLGFLQGVPSGGLGFRGALGVKGSLKGCLEGFTSSLRLRLHIGFLEWFLYYKDPLRVYIGLGFRV